MDLKNLLCEQTGGVATLTIHRPDKLNALNQATLIELDGAIDALAQDNAVRVIIITGAGEKAFVAGADISEINGLSPTLAHQFSSLGQSVMRKIERMGKPVIAMVNGFALGGGLELALACHLRLASEHARVGLPEIKLGILPGFGGTQRLTRLVGRTQALSMMLTGEPIDAHRAHAIGLVNEVIGATELVEHTMKLAQTLAESAPLAMAGILEAVILGQEVDMEAALSLETARFALTCATEDMQEGTQAFLEKRPAQFKGS